jgi:hypothetical protein
MRSGNLKDLAMEIRRIEMELNIHEAENVPLSTDDKSVQTYLDELRQIRFHDGALEISFRGFFKTLDFYFTSPLVFKNKVDDFIAVTFFEFEFTGCYDQGITEH